MSMAALFGDKRCAHCEEPIRSTPMIEHLAMPPRPELIGGGSRIVDIWTHVSSGHERCEGRDTFAAPAS
jgi:hypothetical protein